MVPERLAKGLAALLNLDGGYLLLGVEDDRTVSGLTRAPEKTEERVMEIARTHLRTATIPFWETSVWDEGKIVGVVKLTQIRAGAQELIRRTTQREADEV